MLSQRLIEEKSLGFKGSIYYKVQIELAYNSNHIEGSQLNLNFMIDTYLEIQTLFFY